MNSSLDAEIIIVGGGLVGLTLAAALLRAGLSVIVLESSDAPLPSPVAPDATQFDQRVFAINRASENIFRALGQGCESAWTVMQEQRISPYHNMQVWEKQGSIEFCCADIFEENLGHIIEQQVMLVALQRIVQSYDTVQILRPAQWQSFTTHEQHIQVDLQDGRSLKAAVLIGADGAHSKVREQAGIQWDSQPYGHHALVATVRTELPHAKTAWQRFLPTGPLAFLPLSEPHTSSIVWSTPPEHAKALLNMSPAEFADSLQKAFDSKLGVIEATHSRGVFPLVRRHAKQYVLPRLALVGDALRTIHPLAGQGVNMGLLDAAALADVLIKAHAQHHDVGSYWTLRGYERWRKGHNLLMLNSMDAFKHLFSNDILPLRVARNLSLNVANKAPWFKQHMILQAMGVKGGDLPSLARWTLNEVSV